MEQREEVVSSIPRTDIRHSEWGDRGASRTAVATECTRSMDILGSILRGDPDQPEVRSRAKLTVDGLGRGLASGGGTAEDVEPEVPVALVGTKWDSSMRLGQRNSQAALGLADWSTMQRYDPTSKDRGQWMVTGKGGGAMEGDDDGGAAAADGGGAAGGGWTGAGAGGAEGESWEEWNEWEGTDGSAATAATAADKAKAVKAAKKKAKEKAKEAKRSVMKARDLMPAVNEGERFSKMDATSMKDIFFEKTSRSDTENAGEGAKGKEAEGKGTGTAANGGGFKLGFSFGGGDTAAAATSSSSSDGGGFKLGFEFGGDSAATSEEAKASKSSKASKKGKKGEAEAEAKKKGGKKREGMDASEEWGEGEGGGEWGEEWGGEWGTIEGGGEAKKAKSDSKKNTKRGGSDADGEGKDGTKDAKVASATSFAAPPRKLTGLAQWPFRRTQTLEECRSALFDKRLPLVRDYKHKRKIALRMQRSSQGGKSTKVA
jgi:hypothetical protein